MNDQDDLITMTLPADVRYISVARLVTAGIAARAGLSIDATEDTKVAISEAATNVTEHAYKNSDGGRQPSKLTFTVRDGQLTISVEDEGCGFDPKHLPDMSEKEFTEDTGLGLYLIKELMEDVTIQSAPGSGTKITMTKRTAG